MFKGFSEATVDFLWNIRLNNNREWFLAHKQDYLDHVAAPITALAEDVSAALRGEYPDARLHTHVSRIYRDARRLHGREPYKDHMWFTLRTGDDLTTDTPVFWFEIGPDDWQYGLGYYMARPETMRARWRRIDKRPDELRTLAEKLNGQSTFVLAGDWYKRPKGQAEGVLAPWYNLRTFSLEHTEPVGPVITEPALAARIAEGFRFLMPYNQYFSTLPFDPDPGDSVQSKKPGTD